MRMCIYLFSRTRYVTRNRKKEKCRLTNFQSRIHMYPYHTETAAIIGIKPIAIHTS